MPKQILIDSCFGMVRTAISEGRELLDYYEESPDQGRNKGNIYRGVVKKVDAPIQAAFVKFAGGRDGFLPLRDAAGKPPKPGDSVLVQVVKDEVADKGAALTAKLSLSGRYLVYIPERDGEGGISSKISDEERAALKKILGQLRIPDGASVILRTAASDKSVEALQEDLDLLIGTHRELAEKFDAGGEPALLFREAPPALRYLREYYTDEIERVWVNQEDVLEQCRQFFHQYEPDSVSKVVLSQDGPLLFQRLGLEADVEKLSLRRVSLRSGANFVIDQTEALVAIDVNSAKAGGRGEEPKPKEAKGRGKDRRHGGDLEETVFAVNKEAAGEIARQLRLRDLGGIIIVDFIDMEQEKHRRQIEETMRKALATDKAKVKVYDISPLGIMQISRQRLRKAGHQFSHLHCESCQGRGWHPSATAGALGALRKAEEKLIGKKPGLGLSITVPYPVANRLINDFREHLNGLEKRYGCNLRVTAMPAASGDAAIVVLGGGEGGGEVRGRDSAPAPSAARQREPRQPEARPQTAAPAPGRERRQGTGKRREIAKPVEISGTETSGLDKSGIDKRGTRKSAEPAREPLREPAAEPIAHPDRIAAEGEVEGEGRGGSGGVARTGRKRGHRGGRGRRRGGENAINEGAVPGERRTPAAREKTVPQPRPVPQARSASVRTPVERPAKEASAAEGSRSRPRRRRGRGGSTKTPEAGRGAAG